MKTEKIIWGLILVFIGGILLLQNFGVIDFQWFVIWRFWPLILILIGANMLFSRENSQTGAIISVVLTLSALVFIGWQGTRDHHEGKSRWFFNEWEDEPKSDVKHKSGYFSEPYSASTTSAILNISGGATTYKLEDTTSELFNAKVSSSFGNYSLVKISNDSSETLNFKMSGKAEWDMREKGPNEAVMALNSNPLWTINVETGAGKAWFDLSKFKVQSFNFEGGATKLDVKLGAPLATTNVNVETGVSQIHISIPSNAACKINTDSGLSSSDFEGFDKQSDGSYITPNFSSAKEKFIIKLEGGLSKFDVDRY